jgi:stage II sporulation protein GA (sporulation sigma-E factor processing peptidase)
LLAATVGTAFALIMPLLTYTGVIAFLIKLLVGAAVVFAVQHKNLARYILFYLLFLTYTFAFGGAIYGLTFMFESTGTSLLYFQSTTSIPIGAFVLCGVVFAKIMQTLIKFLNVRHSINNCLRDVVIHCNGEKFKITSYLDTGNRLIDPISRAPVVIITLSLFLKIFPDVAVDRIVLNKLAGEQGITDGRYINFATVDKAAGKMFIFAPQRIDIVEHKSMRSHENVRLGVSMKGFRDAVKYDALLNASFA